MVVWQAQEEEEGLLGGSHTEMLDAQIDPVEWKRELERVGPRLKVAAFTHDACRRDSMY